MNNVTIICDPCDAVLGTVQRGANQQTVNDLLDAHTCPIAQAGIR